MTKQWDSKPDCTCRDCGHRFNADEEGIRATLDAYAGPDDYDLMCPVPGCGSTDLKFDYRPDRSTDLVKDRA